jgi:precorrin-6A/cobalt-precorrin-6A reductase
MISQPLYLLILGGSAEASALARRLAGDDRFRVTFSLAGRTKSPAPQPVPVRTGGFGGVDGLVQFLAAEGIDILVDATHPFAAQMSRHAVEAARRGDTPLLSIRRPPWTPASDDRWTVVENMAAAAEALGAEPRTVFLTVGQKELAPFKACPQHSYVVRSVDPPPAHSLPPNVTIITARGPFELDGERSLLSGHGIEVIVTKNSGGAATAAKLVAARELGLPVIMVARPELPKSVGESESVADAGAAFAWLEEFAAAAHATGSGTRRGV